MSARAVPAPLARRHRGRWLAGVCAGLAARSDLPVGRLRAAFVVAALCFGLGVLVYAACWLILPAEGENGAAAGQRGIVLLAQVFGGLLGLGTLGGAGAVATVFGFGYVVVALAAAVLVGTLAGWGRLGPAWALLPIGALVLPSVAFAVGGVRVDPSTTSRVLAPRALSDLPAGGLHSGLGLLTVDLRRTRLPTDGRFTLRIDAGVRRTLVALPHDRCVHVELHRHALSPALRIGAALLGGTTDWIPEATVFGRPWYEGRVNERARSRRHPGPTLRLDFSSDGGGLIVRDYPDDVDPAGRPDWPGYAVFPESRPHVARKSPATRARILRRWRVRHRVEVRDKERIDRLLPGPCAAPEGRR